MRYIILAATLSIVAACGKLEDTVKTFSDGYALKCIDGTQYVLMTSERGLAITPHLSTEGNPKGCIVK